MKYNISKKDDLQVRLHDRLEFPLEIRLRVRLRDRSIRLWDRSWGWLYSRLGDRFNNQLWVRLHRRLDI